MARWFNIGGPCNAAKNYMLSATDRLPEVAALVHKERYFVVHAPRQCGKTTAFLSFANEINATGGAVALYCSLETVQEFPDPREGLALVYQCICGAARRSRAFGGCPFIAEDAPVPPVEHVLSEGVSNLLSKLAVHVGKPLVMFFDEAAVPFQYREAYPQLVLQAFLQRVINGGGEIIREMALGKKAMDLGVLFRGAKYAVECKKVSFYEKSHEKAYDQVCGYMDRLGVGEGWLVVFDPDLSKPWDGKIFAEDVPWRGKTIHLIGC